MFALTFSIIALATAPSAAPLGIPAKQVWCTGAAEQAAVTVNEPIWMRLECENRGATEASLDFFTGSGVGWGVVPNDGTIGCFTKDDAQNVPPNRVALAPGDHAAVRVLLNRWTGRLQAGMYRTRLVSCAGAYTIDAKGGQTLSDEVTVTVGPLDEKRLEKACKALTSQALNPAAAESARLQAAEALSWIDHPLAVPYLQEVMLKGRTAERLAVQGLSRIRTPEAVRVLVDAFDRDAFLAIEIRDALLKMHSVGLDADLQKRVTNILNHEFKVAQ
jgi:hypothetical protein